MPPIPDPALRLTVELKLQRRDRVLATVVRCAELFAIEAPWRDLVPSALAVLGEATGVSRVYLFEVVRGSRGERIASQRFEWCAPGVTPQIDNPDLQGIDLIPNGYGRWVERMEAGEPVYGDVEDFPESERDLLRAQDILSLLVQPIQAGARWWGFVGFDACAARQAWDRVEVDVLRIMPSRSCWWIVVPNTRAAMRSTSTSTRSQA